MSKKKKNNSIVEFLQSLDLQELGFSKELIKQTLQVEKTFEALGVIKQKLIKQDKKQLLSRFDKAVEKEIKKLPKENTLFPNKLPDQTFGISTVISDPYSNVLDISTENMETCYKNGRVIKVNVGKKKEVILGHKKIDPDCFMGSLPEFLEIMTKWHDPRIIQHWCCCWNWACQNQRFYFPYVPINDILATIYSSSKGKFCHKSRQAFSSSLRFFHNATIELPVAIETTTQKGKKKVEHATKMFRLFNLDLAKKNKKGDVYLKVAGQLLPGLDPGKFRGRIFPKGIFTLDANREGGRILLAYKICNRLDQMSGKPIEWTIDNLIKIAGLSTTSLQNKTAACEKLTRTLNRISEVGCIDGFKPQKISARKTNTVLIYPSNVLDK